MSQFERFNHPNLLAYMCLSQSVYINKNYDDKTQLFLHLCLYKSLIHSWLPRGFISLRQAWLLGWMYSLRAYIPRFSSFVRSRDKNRLWFRGQARCFRRFQNACLGRRSPLWHTCKDSCSYLWVKRRWLNLMPITRRRIFGQRFRYGFPFGRRLFLYLVRRISYSCMYRR